MISIIFILVILSVTFLTCQFASRAVYGRIIPENELDEFLGKHLNGYSINEYAGVHSKLLYLSEYPYIADQSFDLFSKWHIARHGRISRRSKWSKRLDDYYANLPNSRRKLSGL